MFLRIEILLILISSCQLSSQNTWPDKTRILPEALRKVPVAIYIQHGPNPNYPEINDTGENQNAKYVWKHETQVCSPNKKLKVIHAGSFIWYDESGWKENVSFSRSDFKNRFNCPAGTLIPGSCYTFKENYRWGSNLYGGDALWYVLAKDDDGVIYKGIGLLETESELLKN